MPSPTTPPIIEGVRQTSSVPIIATVTGIILVTTIVILHTFYLLWKRRGYEPINEDIDEEDEASQVAIINPQAEPLVAQDAPVMDSVMDEYRIIEEIREAMNDCDCEHHMLEGSSLDRGSRDCII